MKRSRLCIAFLSAVILPVCLSSCGSGNDAHETEEKDTAQAEQPVTNEPESGSYDVFLPSPLQIARIFQRSGLPYEAGLIHSTADVTKYDTRMSQTLNFGVYSADLAYLVLNKQSQDAMAHMKVVKQLAASIGLSPIFNDEKLLASFERNIGIEDSMITTLVSIQEKLQVSLEDNEQEYLNAVIFAGAWIESMYLGSQLSGKTDNTNLSSRIIEQMTILESLIRGLQQNPSADAELNGLTTRLEEVKDLYSNFAAIKALDGSGDYNLEQLVITTEEQKALTAKLKEIRTSIIQG